jgi:hydroxyethylthiazole kinase-like uncharacterized protein yjeF
MDPELITPSVLRRLPLPEPDEDADKEDRGRVLIVGGSKETPGAIILAAVAALRAGAGKLRAVTCESIAPAIAVAVPEGRIMGLPETRSGSLKIGSAEKVAAVANEAGAVVFGPGMIDNNAAIGLVQRVLGKLGGPAVTLDAAALMVLQQSPDALHKLNGRVVLTPHAGEMAGILETSAEEIGQDRVGVAVRAARTFNAVVALKGRETVIAAPDGKVYANRAGNVGLATSGSGDVLSGIVAGLLSRGADPITAAVWGVSLHARAGDVLAKRFGRVGFLARELLNEIPGLMNSIAHANQKR